MRSTRAKPCPITPREVLRVCVMNSGFDKNSPLTPAPSPARGEGNALSTGTPCSLSPPWERAGVRGLETIPALIRYAHTWPR